MAFLQGEKTLLAATEKAQLFCTLYISPWKKTAMRKWAARAMPGVGATSLALNRESPRKGCLHKQEFFRPSGRDELPAKQAQKCLLLSMRTAEGQRGIKRL